MPMYIGTFDLDASIRQWSDVIPDLEVDSNIEIIRWIWFGPIQIAYRVKEKPVDDAPVDWFCHDIVMEITSKV